MKLKKIVLSLFILLFISPISVGAVTIPNPVSGDFLSIISKLTSFIRPFTILVFILVMFWGGFQIEIAGDKTEKVTNGMKTIAAGIVGLIIMFLAPTIPDLIGAIFGTGTLIDI